MTAKTVWAGRFLEMRVEGTWEYVVRARSISAAVILAIEDSHILLVEQYRVPLGRNCIELPAGLVGDDDSSESVEASALRELEEETGYRASRIELLGEFVSSPGLTSESFHLVRATGLEKISGGGGVDGENITVHRIAINAVAPFIAARRTDGCAIDAKLLPLLALLPVAGGMAG